MKFIFKKIDGDVIIVCPTMTHNEEQLVRPILARLRVAECHNLEEGEFREYELTVN